MTSIPIKDDNLKLIKEEIRSSLAKKLYEARRSANLSQESVAEQMGMPRSTISVSENGKRSITAEELVLFSKVYSVDISYLLGFDSSPGLNDKEVTKIVMEIIKKLKG